MPSLREKGGDSRGMRARKKPAEGPAELYTHVLCEDDGADMLTS